MKCRSIFLGEKKKHIISLLSAEFAQRMMKVYSWNTLSCVTKLFLAHLSMKCPVSVVRLLCVVCLLSSTFALHNLQRPQF